MQDNLALRGRLFSLAPPLQMQRLSHPLMRSSPASAASFPFAPPLPLSFPFAPPLPQGHPRARRILLDARSLHSSARSRPDRVARRDPYCCTCRTPAGVAGVAGVERCVTKRRCRRCRARVSNAETTFLFGKATRSSASAYSIEGA